MFKSIQIKPTLSFKYISLDDFFSIALLAVQRVTWVETATADATFVACVVRS